MIPSPLESSSSLLTHLLNSPPWLQASLLGLGTFFISEDMTTLAAGLWVAQGKISWAIAFWGCFLGIFLGDFLLYILGYFVGRPVLTWPFFRRILKEEKILRGEQWFRENGITVVIASRFLPGTRLPTYFAAGLLRARAQFFLLAALIACALWTPLLLFLAYWFGQRVLLPFQFLENHPLLGFLFGFSILGCLFTLVNLLINKDNRAFLRDRIYRWTHWEFWPLKVFYAPVFLFNIWSSLKYRSLNAPLYCNPAIPFSGFKGESKSSILELFQGFPSHTLPYIALEAGQSEYTDLESDLHAKGLTFPVILKPDRGERGSGVTKVKTLTELLEALKKRTGLQLIQAYHPGPLEFGISYVRLPNQEKGRIMGITGKKFPTLMGNGKDTQRTLMLQNPDCKGRLKLLRHEFNETVLPDGEKHRMVEIGNHCLGTLFNDASHLISPQLEQRIDELAQHSPGIFIGRFDIRTTSAEAFQQRAEFKILEFNGATSEPAFVYDRRHSLWFAWKTFFSYWKKIWIIGLANQKRIPSRLTWRKLRDFDKEF